MNNVVLDVNVLIGAFQASGTPGVLPTPQQFSKTTAGYFFHLAWKGRTFRGETVHLCFSKHIVDTFAHVVHVNGLGDKKQAAAWLVNLILALPKAAWSIDPEPEDYAALRRRAERPDGVRDAHGRPDTEDEAVLRLCAARGAVLVTFEADENLPTAARRRGIDVVAARAIERDLARHLIAA